MMKPTWKVFLLTCGLLAVWGCGPPVLTTALPPGVEPPPEEIPESQRAEALGEAAALDSLQPSAPTSVAVIPAAPPTEPDQTALTQGGVSYTTIKPGEGDQALSGKTVVIHYALTLEDGTKVEESRSSDKPLTFVIGARGIISGMQQGVAGMKVGEVRKLTIPPNLGYGSEASAKIPANSTLIFEVELLKVE